MKMYRVGLNYLKPMFFPTMVRKIEQMAEEGWVLWKIRHLFVIYKRQEPVTIRCNLKIMETSLFDTKEEKKQKDEFHLQCEEQGWEYLGTTRNTQVYITKNLLLPDIPNDQKLEWEEAKRSIRLVLSFIGLIMFYLVFFVYEVTKVIDVMHLLTNNLLFCYSGLLILLFVKVMFEGFFLVYWYARNRTWLKDNNIITKRHNFTDAFALWFGVIRVIFLFFMLLVIAYSGISMSVNGFLRTSSLFLTIHIISKMMSSIGKKNEQRNKEFVRMTLTLLLFGVIAVFQYFNPIAEKWRNPTLYRNEIITFSDLEIDKEPVHFTRDPMNSIFTWNQIEYAEEIDNHFVTTKIYPFKNKLLLNLYLWDLNRQNKIIPFLSNSVTGGYLDDDQKSLYFIQDTTIFQVTASVSLSDKLAIIFDKLIR